MPQELILPDPDDNSEIAYVRPNLFELASTLLCDSSNEVLGSKMIDIAKEWEIKGKNSHC